MEDVTIVTGWFGKSGAWSGGEVNGAASRRAVEDYSAVNARADSATVLYE